MTRDSQPLVVTPLHGIPEIREGDEVAACILASLQHSGVALKGGDIIAVAQKIISKAEGRRVRLSTVTPSTRAQELAVTTHKDPRIVELILQESSELVRCRPGLIIVADRRGFVMANAGIDASNVGTTDDSVLLLPIDPDASARRMRDALHAATGATIGVVIIDSFGRAWRMGTIGTAIGLAGIPGLLDLRGRPDRDGRLLQSSELAVADEVAAAASLMMGQSNEGCPVVHIRGFPYPAADGKVGELLRPKNMDLFR